LTKALILLYNKIIQSEKTEKNSRKEVRKMKWVDRLYMGTWQFSGQFKHLTRSEIEELIDFALQSGIRRFDTAAVYGGGEVEKILGACLPLKAIVVTKIPAVFKPPLDSIVPIRNFYTSDLIYSSVEGSLRRLKRESIYAVLLHNWHPSWSLDAIEIIEVLNNLKEKGVVERIGVSLPNGFNARIDDRILSYLDVIEAPFNPEERWILNQLPEMLDMKKEVLLRSLFLQGRLLKMGYTARNILSEVMLLNTAVVIGMTTKWQITENINILKGGEKNALV
jgi:aryl-alcohol dehydrogenase-like predicted oxidoreductase